MADQAGLTSVNKKDIDLFVTETNITTMRFPGRKGALNRQMEGQQVADESVRAGDIQALSEQVSVDAANTYILVRVDGDTENKVVKAQNMPGASHFTTLDGVATEATHSITVNTFLTTIIFSNPNPDDIVVDVGTTAAGTELIEQFTVVAGATFVEFVISRFLAAGTTIHFTLNGDTLDIILIKLT